MPYAVVAVDDPHARPAQTHHYRLPEELVGASQPASLVIVPFGRKLRRGWLLQLAGESPVDEPRPVIAALADAPRPSEQQLSLARWLSRRAHISLARAIALAMPDPLLDGCLSRLHLARGTPADRERRFPEAAPLLRRLRGQPVRLDRAWLLLPPTAAGLLQDLETAAVVERLPPLQRRPAAPVAPPAAPAPIPDRPTRDLCNAVFADLTNRRAGVFVASSAAWPLAAVEQLVRHTLSGGRQALLLLPRPTRRSPPIQALLARFPDALFLGSARGLGEVATAQPPLTIGGRWTPLAAFANLGLVLVIDEHDHAYAGEQPPYLHGRELALQAARFAGASTVLFSPTPDPATLWRASRAGVRRFTLSAPPPVHTTLVDLRQELRAGRAALLSAPLRANLLACLAAGQQAVLLLNRRGSAAVLGCRRCGFAPSCERCSATLAYHADSNSMRCPCCNAAVPRPERCPRCQADALDELGAGIQRLLHEVQAAFPSARLARWDRDSVAAKGDAALVARFRDHQTDLLVGTQLVAQEESLPPVALAAAILADVGLHLPDYRAAERSFELLSALRRRIVPGGAFVIQTYHPAHWVLQALAADDPALFYGEELRRRQELGYPPFAQLARFTCRAASRERAEAEARRLHAALATRIAQFGPELPATLLGPAPAPVERLRNRYRWQLYLRAPNVQPFLDLIPPHWLVELDPEALR